MAEFDVGHRPARGFRAVSLTAWLGNIVISGLGIAMVVLGLSYPIGLAIPCILFGIILLLFGGWTFCRGIMIVFGFITKDTPPGPVGRMIMRPLGTVTKRK